jgi:hypothetical protein
MRAMSPARSADSLTHARMGMEPTIRRAHEPHGLERKLLKGVDFSETPCAYSFQRTARHRRGKTRRFAPLGQVKIGEGFRV